MNTNIFREYDIRGIVGEHLTDESSYRSYRKRDRQSSSASRTVPNA